MRIVLNDDELEKGVLSLLKHLPGNKILIDHFLTVARKRKSTPFSMVTTSM
jgi:hypothetical protein